MDNLEEKLNSLLNDPNAMKTIMDLARQISGNTQQNTQSENVGSLDPALMARFLPLLREFQNDKNDSVNLLFALQPYLSEAKREKVSQAVKLAHLIHVGKKFLSEGGWELV